MFGSGRAILTLRESYRSALREVKKVTDFRYVRFHNILHDEVGVYDEDKSDNPLYNFSYVDQIYDGLLANGVRPCVEISFMPRKPAARQDVHPFWYHPLVSPPKDYAKWDALIRALAGHLIERYGIDEVAQWYFKVWNEPNIGTSRAEAALRAYSFSQRSKCCATPVPLHLSRHFVLLSGTRLFALADGPAASKHRYFTLAVEMR